MNDGPEYTLPSGDTLPAGDALPTPGQTYLNGVVSDWTGRVCARCNGDGRNDDWTACNGCGGTGEEYSEVWLVEQ